MVLNMKHILIQYAMSLKNANKNKKQHEASSATFRDGGNGSEGNKRTMVCVSDINIHYKLSKLFKYTLWQNPSST